MTKKLNCETGNSQCGGKCQNKSNKCPSEKGPEASAATDKFTKLVAKPETLESLFEDYENLISPEGKKKSRAKIAKLPNKKALKKELLASEAKAWAFVRLMREKSRLAKKGEEVGDLDTLLQKIADGDEDSINKALVSLDSKIAEKRKAKTEAKASKSAVEVIESVVAAIAKPGFEFQTFSGYSEKFSELAERNRKASQKSTKEPYSTNTKIWEKIVKENAEDDENIQVITASKNGEELEAALSYVEEPSYYLINYLATNPKNLDKSNSDYVRGAGSSLLLEIAKMAAEEYKYIMLESTDVARPFYEKLGFVEDEEIGYMVLVQEKIEELLKQLQV